MKPRWTPYWERQDDKPTGVRACRGCGFFAPWPHYFTGSNGDSVCFDCSGGFEEEPPPKPVPLSRLARDRPNAFAELQAALTAPQRQAVDLYYGRGFTLAQTGQVMSIG